MGEISLDHFCRLCLKETFTLSNIFSQRSASGDPVYQTLNFLYDLEICQDDGLPTQICAPCLWRMIEFEAYKRNVHCAKVEILKLFGKTRKDKGEISGAEYKEELGMDEDGPLEDKGEISGVEFKEELGMDDDGPLEHGVSEAEEEEDDPALCHEREKIPVPYGRVYGDEWAQHHPSHQQLHQLSQHHVSQQVPPIAQPSQQVVFPQVLRAAPVWPKDISVRPIAVPPQPTMPEGYLSQSGVHFLAGALLTNSKVSKEVDEELDTAKPLRSKDASDLQNQQFVGRVCVKQEVEDIEEQNLDDEMHRQEVLDLAKQDSRGAEGAPPSLCAEDLRWGASKMVEKESKRLSEGPVLDGKEAYVCDVCKKSYSEKIHLGEHMKYHYQNRHYFCRVCGDRFQQSRARGRHELLHIKDEVYQLKKEKPHTCSTCGKQFSSKSSFYRHCNEHTDKYACPTCGKSFSCSKDLKRHTIIHSNEKPFQCEICQRSFNQKGNLNKHMVTHSMERPFNCTMCDRKFKTKRERNNHELTHLRRQVFPKASPILH